MNKSKIIILFGLFCCFSVFADQTIVPETDTALFELKASTTLGVNMDTGATGLITSIDQVGLWFELFPGTEKGFTDDNEGWNAQFTIQGMKWALKRFESVNFWDGTDNTYSESFLLNSGDDFEWDNLKAIIFKGPIWAGITLAGDGDYSAVKSSSFSLNSLFSQNSYASLSVNDFLLSKSQQEGAGTVIPVIDEVFSPSYAQKTGFICGGWDSENLQVDLTIQSTTDWWDTSLDKNGYAYDLQCDWKTENGFEIEAAIIGGIGNQEYDSFDDGSVNGMGMGGELSYRFALKEGLDLKFSGGLDGYYSSAFNFEAGGAISLLWPGYSDTSLINSLMYSGTPGWDFEYTIDSGFCAAANYVSSYEKNKSYKVEDILNLRFSISDANLTASLIPKVGLMGILDISNVTEVPVDIWENGGWVESSGERGIGGGIYLDYNIEDTWIPYAKLIVNTLDVLDVEAGIRMNIIDHTLMVLRYYNGRKYYQGASKKETGDIGNLEFSVYLSN